jgi:hypothetical protein
MSVSFFGFGQKATGFYLKLHQFNYPSEPLPSSCEVYGVSAQVGNKSIVTRDYRGDLLVLHDLKVLWGGYDPGKTGYVPKLFSFDKYHKSTIPYENGFLLKIQMDNVELYHEYTGKDDIYEIKGDYEYRLSVTHQNKLITTDTLKYQEILGSFSSTLPAEDVHIIATNKASELAIYLNEKILTSSVNAFRNFASRRVDLTYSKEFIKFYGISKLKKLSSGEKVKELEKRLKNLKDLDEEVLNRDNFDREVEMLVDDFKKLIDSEDYNIYDSYKFYINANLASLHAITESYSLVDTYYETALKYNKKARFVSIAADELHKSRWRMNNKSLLFKEDGKFDTRKSQKYSDYFKTRKRANN